MSQMFCIMPVRVGGASYDLVGYCDLLASQPSTPAANLQKFVLRFSAVTVIFLHSSPCHGVSETTIFIFCSNQPHSIFSPPLTNVCQISGKCSIFSGMSFERNIPLEMPAHINSCIMDVMNNPCIKLHIDLDFLNQFSRVSVHTGHFFIHLSSIKESDLLSNFLLIQKCTQRNLCINQCRDFYVLNSCE